MTIAENKRSEVKRKWNYPDSEACQDKINTLCFCGAGLNKINYRSPFSEVIKNLSLIG
jgi:hypothetical protein